MSDPDRSTARLEDLRERWDEDPRSRVFVQLAEEYRRRGEPEQALEVLESGLTHHPSYLSARVALARCQMELGRPDEALGNLRSVLEKDPTHLLAGKLVIETHLARGERGAAREALDRYRLLGAPEEEVDELTDRLEAGPGPEASDLGGEAVENPLAAQVSDPQAGAAAAKRAPSGEVFELPRKSLATSLPWSAGNGGTKRRVRGLAGRAPWRLDAEADRQAYRQGLSGEVLGFEEPDGTTDEMSEAVAAPEEASSPIPLEPGPESLPEPDEPEEEFSAVPPTENEARPAEPESPAEPELGDAPAETTPEPAPPEPSVPAEERAAGATATLGDLYLRQGHLAEAEAIYREVLERNPAHAGALRGLETLALRSQDWVTAHELLAAAERPEGLTATKRALLERYLKRLKRGAGRDVSRPTS